MGSYIIGIINVAVLDSEVKDSKLKISLLEIESYVGYIASTILDPPF